VEKGWRALQGGRYLCFPGRNKSIEKNFGALFCCRQLKGVTVTNLPVSLCVCVIRRSMKLLNALVLLLWWRPMLSPKQLDTWSRFALKFNSGSHARERCGLHHDGTDRAVVSKNA